MSNQIDNSNIDQNFIPDTAIGADTFRELVEHSTVFVDKTMLIHEYLSNSNKITLITYPRHWGKTINMDMIRSFLELKVDANGAQLTEDQKQNHKLFQNLAIWQNQEFVAKHLGKYPVILISFKDTKGNNYNKMSYG